LDEKSRGSDAAVIPAANDIDSAVMKHMSLLMGPFDLADLTGIDTIYHVAEVIYEGFQRAPRYRPSPLLKRYHEEGLVGRKAGRGIYHYANRENDPDLNPPLDARGQALTRKENPAFDSAELLAVVVNECCRVLEEGLVGGPEEIEACMELGTRWPKGPFRLAGEAGLEKLRAALARRLADTDGNPRYESCELLRSPSPQIVKCMSSKEE
jgi:3-hydroxyacyl-CoA dehydrogenase